MEILMVSIVAVIIAAANCKDQAEIKREKKDVSKLQNLGLGFSGNKFRNSYPSGGYLPPNYNYYNNYDLRRGCYCRTSPSGPDFINRPVPAPRPPSGPDFIPNVPPQRAVYGPPRQVDDTVVIYPTINRVVQPQPRPQLVVQPSRNSYIPPRPSPPLDDTVVVYPSVRQTEPVRNTFIPPGPPSGPSFDNSVLIYPPAPSVRLPPPTPITVIKQNEPQVNVDSGYNYERPSVPFNQ